VRKIVQDQLGIDIQGKPAISFSLSPLVPDTPLITSGSSTTPASTSSASYSEPVSVRGSGMGVERMPPPEDEPEVDQITYNPSGPSGIDLARSDPFAKTRTESMIEPIPGEDDPTIRPAPTSPTDEDRDQLASQG
jgi:hypothetical protein